MRWGPVYSRYPGTRRVRHQSESPEKLTHSVAPSDGPHTTPDRGKTLLPHLAKVCCSYRKALVASLAILSGAQHTLYTQLLARTRLFVSDGFDLGIKILVRQWVLLESIIEVCSPS